MTPLIDALAHTRFETRAKAAPALFLRAAIRDDLEDRLAGINRPFPRAAVITAFAEVWDGFDAQILSPAEILPLAEASFDLVILDLTLHWANDPVGQLIQARRALVPDGLLLAPLLGGETLFELKSVLAQAEVALCGGLRPRVLPMAEIRDLGALLQRAGLALPVADSFTLTATYPDLFALARDLRAMGESNALMARPRHFTRKSLFSTADQLYRAQFSTREGRLRASFEIICLTAWAPAPTQQRPLKPGSARHALADVLASLAITPRQSTKDAVDAALKPHID